jgi:hypothetical protein
MWIMNHLDFQRRATLVRGGLLFLLLRPNGLNPRVSRQKIPLNGLAVGRNVCKFAASIQNGPVVQWIEQVFPKYQIQVRSLAGLQKVGDAGFFHCGAGCGCGMNGCDG